MLDLLSPLRGYIAQNLQFYLSKYIEDIQLEGLGLFGGDLVLNDLEIKRHVLRESLEIPSSFDFSRGFIRELRIHIPWTQLLSQPIEVKLYTIELILTAKDDDEQKPRASSAADKKPKTADDGEALPSIEDKIDQPKSGWIQDTLQKILANISVQVNNLVLKYEHDDVVFSIALGTLDFYSASEGDGWKRSFEDLKRGRRTICKRIDAKDVTIFLDRYTNDGEGKKKIQESVRRKVVGYEVPVLSRTSASVRAKLQLFPNVAGREQEDRNNKSASPRSTLHQQRPGPSDDSSIIDVDGLFAYRPSVICDPFYYYSCKRSSVVPMYEVDVFVGELFFSVSDRQLEMLNQLIQSASRKIDRDYEPPPQARTRDYNPDGEGTNVLSNTRAVTAMAEVQKVDCSAKKSDSWFGWAMNALGTTEDEEEDELVSELLAETRGALLKVQQPPNYPDDDLFTPGGPSMKTSCVRVCVSSASVTLRKHEKEPQVEHQDSAVVESGEELVPVANLGMVKVSHQPSKRKVARPAVPILHLTLSYVALEMLLARGESENGTDLVFEIEKVELVSATASENREELKCKKGEVLLTWGSIDSSHFSACVSHPYFINSFFGEETTRLNQRESRSFEIVKVNLDADIPVWKTLEASRDSKNADEDSPCNCFTKWDGHDIRCVPIATIARICEQAIRTIGIKERVLDGGILSNAASTAWASSGFPISISEEIARAFASVAEEYRAHRNPDLGALDNLAQLLQPQLMALFSRYTLHSCSAASLRPPTGSSNIRHRSVHSALRMRLASTSNSVECGDPALDRHAKEVSKVFDLSIGTAQALLIPEKCVEIMEALSIFMDEANDGDLAAKSEEVSVSATEIVAPSSQFIMQSDVKLITASTLRIRLPTAQGQDNTAGSSYGDVNIIGRDFSWWRAIHPGSYKNRLQLGAMAASMEKVQDGSTSFPLVEALGFEVLTTEDSADASDNDGLFASMIKLRIDLDLSAVQDAVDVINGIADPLGYPIAWVPICVTPMQARSSFHIEVCRAGFSRIVANRPRVVLAQYQSLSGEIASVSATLKWSNRRIESCRSIFQSGVAPMSLRGSESSTPFAKFAILQQKSSGVLNHVPLVSSLGLFSLNPGSLTTTCKHSEFTLQAHVSPITLDMQGLIQLIDTVICFVDAIVASLPIQKKLPPTLEGFEEDMVTHNSTSSDPTGWKVTVDLIFAGGDIRVNEALQLKLPLLSLSSVEKDLGPANQVQSGGVLNLVFAMKNATLRASESGVLKELGDPEILRIEGIGISMDFSHSYVDYRHAYAVDATVHVSSIQTSLSRLKLLYLLKIPYSEQLKKSPSAEDFHQPEKPEGDSKTAAHYRWYWRLGAQLDRVGFSCTADINHHSNIRERQIRSAVDGKMLSIGLAARVSNYHPTMIHVHPAAGRVFTDIQVSVGDIQLVERLRSAKPEPRRRFGAFAWLPEHTFMGVLVCLNLSDLKCLSEVLCISSIDNAEQRSLPPAMLSWHLTNSISKAFQAGIHRGEAYGKQPTAEVPMIATGLTNTGHSFPLVSGFYRNYSEAALPHHVIAGSIDSMDFAITTSCLYCIASVLNVHGNDTSKIGKNGELRRDQSSPIATSRTSLADVEVSILLGQVRLILTNESLMNSILSRRSVVPGNVIMVLESLAIASAVRNDICLDGLGYPPFNSRFLPRRPTAQAQRFGQPELRIGCRVGNISGFVAELEFSQVECTPNSTGGPFEKHISKSTECSVRFTNVETFWSPLNLTCSMEEDPVAAYDGNDAAVKTAATIALTKVRFDLHKREFDVLVTQTVGVIRAVGALQRSITAPSQVKLKPVELQEASSCLDSENQREVAFSCDGIEVNAFERDTSTHIRIGSIVLAHNLSTLSGSASVQNVVVGHRTNENVDSPTIAIEEVVLGVNADPSLWQLTVENYPEKLIAARWNCGERTEGTLFLDVQAYQLHVSHHLIQSLTRFVSTEPNLSFSGSWNMDSKTYVDQPGDLQPFGFQQKWNVKILVAPSVVSYWRRNLTSKRKSGIWTTSGQLFASVGVGTDETARQSVCSYGPVVNDINRFVAASTMEIMLNMDKLGVNMSDDLPPLEVHFQRDSVGLVSTNSSSTWQRFSKYTSVVSEAQRLVHDCSVRLTGDRHQMLERVAVGEEVYLLFTDMARTSLQADVNALCVRLSSYSLGAIQSLVATRDGSDKRLDDSSGSVLNEDDASDTLTESNQVPDTFDSSSDDFKNLLKMAEGRRPSPGELVFTEALLIETHSAILNDAPPLADITIQLQIEPNKFGIGLSDVAAYLKDCNGPWSSGASEPNGERTSYTDFGNKTHSWMGMRWCYHIPRKICKIVASPVPLPPTGVPNGWPSWNWEKDSDDAASRLCDIFCQLRCWDSKKSCYVVLCEFYVPWECAAAGMGSNESEDANEPGSFGELMSQWFDDDMEQTRYRARLLEFGARARVFCFDNDLPSDNWELRWRTPLQSEQESENKQKRLVVNALLASSLQVHSVLAKDAYQRVVSSVTLPQVTLSITHVGSENDAHDIVTAELNDTEINCAASGSSHTRKLNIRAASAMQVYLDNMVQLLTVSVIPRTSIEAMAEITSKGIEISTLVGPVSLYLNQTSMLVLSAIPKILQASSEHFPTVARNPNEKLSDMRTRIVNYTGVDIWYRQEGTSECLHLPTGDSAAYSWLSLVDSPFYLLRFAVDNPRQKLCDMAQPESGQEDSRWCDPCKIRENGVTGRYFRGYGFMWICVELSSLTTIVTLHSALAVRNYCDFPVRVKVNRDAVEYICSGSGELYQDTPMLRKSSYHHANCISSDGSVCTLQPTKEGSSVTQVMTESVSAIGFGIEGGSWCNLETQGRFPSEFDLVKVSDDQTDGLMRTQCNFVTLLTRSPNESTHYAWARLRRVQCNTVLPTDFDPLQPQVSRRYAWMEMSLWPALTVENTMDIPVALNFAQKASTISIKVAPSCEKCLSEINPFEPVNVQLKYDQGSGSPPKPLAFLLQCTLEDSKEHIFVFEGCKVLVSYCNDLRPMVRVRMERILSVANMTPHNLDVKISSPLGSQGGVLEKIASCVERSIGFAVISNRLVISIATTEKSNNESDQIEWSPEVSLNVHGDAKPIVVPSVRTGLRSLASAYCIELENSDGYLKLIIRPQVVVINSTSYDLKFTPTDGRGNAFDEDDQLSVISGDNDGWSVPVCLHKEAKKRSITTDVSNWLSSKLSRRSSEDLSNVSKQVLVARLSCSFRVGLVEDGYEWTEEIAVLLPKLPLLVNSDGKLAIVEPPESSTTPTKTQEGLYPSPSTTTRRRRLLIRHHAFRHKMLTYTMTEKGQSIHIMFFVDHQPPVIIHNQWQNALGFRNVSFPSDPEGIGADFYLEYDWNLQVSAKHHESIAEETSNSNKKDVSESEILQDWLEDSSQSLQTATIADTTDGRVRFQIGSPRYGWSNMLWQVDGIQFASFTSDESGPIFLVMCFYRAGSWLISITCLEDPIRDGQVNTTPSLALPSMASPLIAKQPASSFLRIGVVVEELSLHFCDEYDPLLDARGMILYPEILRATCSELSIVFATAPDPPEISRHSTRLGYLSHIRSYSTLFVAIQDIEVGHFLQTCNFPVILCFPETHARKDLLQFDRVKKHERLEGLTSRLLDKGLPGTDGSSLVARVIYTDTWDPIGIPSYFHSIELHLSPAVLQVEDDILAYVNAFMRPMLDALEGESALRAMHEVGTQPGVSNLKNWSLDAYEAVMVTKQRKVYIEHLSVSNIQVTITARVSIPVLNSFDGTPLYFGATEMREVFSLPDQLYKDLAADYVADAIVRSPMLLMSLNIIGNPAGFLRGFGQGVRDLVEIPLDASRNGYSPWILTKGVVGGVASFLGHATAATLTSLSGFSYSISRTMDQLTLPSDQLRKRHYARPTHLSTALAGGLGSLGSSVVGAAAGVITTPIAVYKERQMQGLDTGLRNVVGGVGMGLVGIVARPMGGVASLVSMASDGLLYGMGGSRTPFDDSISRFDARPNELLRYKLKVLPDAIGNTLTFAQGVWVVPEVHKLLSSGQELDYISEEQLDATENEPIRELLSRGDTTHRLVQVTVVCSSEYVYVVGVRGMQRQAVLVRTSLGSIEAVEESLKEPSVFDLGIKTPASAEWLRFRLPAQQRRHLSHQLRLWLADAIFVESRLTTPFAGLKMELDEGGNASGDMGKPFFGGGDLFRLMKLVRETQCEMEVVKPVLDELEVMRLCCSFGMMPSVNPRDFDFDILSAREFDDDFVRFLRYELLGGNSCGGNVKMKGIFGKQAQVASALVEMDACAADTVSLLTPANEGVYCVKVNPKDTVEGGDEKSSGLVMFAWIRDELFETQELRGTPAFLLRFLTGLTPDVICCTAPSDLQQITDAMATSDEQDYDELSSYSVSFQIEKQEDQPDSTKCVGVSSIDLKTLPEDCSDVCLLKGSYPALAYTKTMSTAIRTGKFQHTFHPNMAQSFPQWLKAESQSYRVDLNQGIVKAVKLCRNILKEFDMWNEEEINASLEAHEKKAQEEFDVAFHLLKDDISKQRAVVDQVSNELFQLSAQETSEEVSDTALLDAMSIYASFQEWVKVTCLWGIDKKIQSALDIPIRLREVEKKLFKLYTSGGGDGNLKTLVEMCGTSTKAEVVKRIKRNTPKPHAEKTAEVDEAPPKTWEAFLRVVSEPLSNLRTKWWLAVESVFAAATQVKRKELERNQKDAKSVWYDSEKKILETKLIELRKILISKEGLQITVTANTSRGRGIVFCQGVREAHAPPTAFKDIVKLNTSNKTKAGQHEEFLGRLLLPPKESHVAMFTVKVRSVVQICTSNHRMCARFVYFPPTTNSHNQPRPNETIVRSWGKVASHCDYDARNRILTFLSEDSVGIYRFDESFKTMEMMKNVDLGVRSTLTELPFTDVLLMDSRVYVTDSSGCSQGIDIHNDQTSNAVSVHDGAEATGACSRMMELADNLAIGVVACVASSDGSFDGVLECVSRDDHRHLPALPFEMKFLTDRVSVQCVGDKVLVLDPLAQRVYVFSIQVTVRSDSYRMRQSNMSGGNPSDLEASNADCPRKQHWMYALYHAFEKFPVRGLLDPGLPPPISIAIACPGVEDMNAALVQYHDYLSLLMSDLMALNKPLHGLDLTSGLTVQRSLAGIGMASKPLKSFLQTLITFLPVQICRAEANALTVLHDGMDPSLEPEEDMQTWGAADIAESIRFGLLSPLLSAWRGRCVVVTSMGKQSTGKSYFLNHLTGSSFAIAGNRCTDGAWMTLRIINDVLLVVLDFEGLGSFERTDQEDVFLSVLNASLSMFTIFRMEMRFDKDIDSLFAKFQKGINLLKNDDRLFQGALYMSVKDVNPNDRHGVLSEFQRKLQNLVTANRDKNFVTEMYSGDLKINCSPPLGTFGYYESLRHARQLIEKLISDPDASRGFKNGNSLHDCIRLVLAKISILDWTAVDESSQRLEMNDLQRKMPGAIRTGCLIPIEGQLKNEIIPRSLKDPLLHDESNVWMLQLEQLSRDYPELAESWAKVNQEVPLNAMDDEDIDFGPSACFEVDCEKDYVHSTLLSLFQHYLEQILKGPLEKIVEKDYENFDALLSFLVCRRKAKVTLWVKQFLGADRFLDEWEQLEQAYLLPFEAVFKRCVHACSDCQLQCLRSVYHSFDEEHDCGMGHVCRGLCEYCMQKYESGKELPRCVGKAGHEGKCDCVKGDHTCGAECSLIGASNCGGICVLIGGHDGDHRCSVKQHACGAACSATNCRGKCILNREHKHTVHKCAETQCKHVCEMEYCKEWCSAANHFHDQPEVGKKFNAENGQILPKDALINGEIVHLCNSRHVCNATCEMEGICSKGVQVSTGKFTGSRDTFEFELKQMVGVRNKCAIVLQPGKTNHVEAPHSCVKVQNGVKTVHGCGVKCAACEYYCDKPVGHEDEHSAAHGNMRNMRFIAEDKVIDWEGHKYAQGEKGIAEMCNMYCSSAGRGHVHYLKCDQRTPSTCVYNGLNDQRRHCTTKVEPHPPHEIDELLHEKYWKTIGWEDPCRSGAERVSFGKCPYMCDAPEHKAEGKAPSYCDLDVWHHPVAAPPRDERSRFSYVSGHRFACSHASTTGILHHIFVLDCSGSMRGRPWFTLMKGVRKYLQSRIASGALQDIVSAVTFGNEGNIVYERMPILHVVKRFITFGGGGTFYSNGLSLASAIISRTNLKVYKPALVFFTDGRPADKKKGLKLATDIRERYSMCGLRSFVVGYGRSSELGLEELAEKLGGTVHEALTTTDLGETFHSISMSLGARAGLIHSSTG